MSYPCRVRRIKLGKSDVLTSVRDPDRWRQQIFTIQPVMIYVLRLSVGELQPVAGQLVVVHLSSGDQLECGRRRLGIEITRQDTGRVHEFAGRSPFSKVGEAVDFRQKHLDLGESNVFALGVVQQMRGRDAKHNVRIG